MTNPPTPIPVAPSEPSIKEKTLWPYHAAILLGLGLAVRLWLIHSYPIVFGGDSIVRLANRDRILLAYQLPLLQAAIHYLSLLSEDPLWVRYFMALMGALAGLGFYYLSWSLLGRTTAFLTALLFVSNPFVLAFSVVPYQEILMLAGLLFGFHFVFLEKWALASFFLGLACLTRYEAWVACPVFLGAFLWRRRIRPLELVRGLLLFGWAPLGWILYNTGIAPGGTYVVDAGPSAERLFRYLYLGWITVKNTPIPVLLLAGLGLWRFWKQGMLRAPRYCLLSAFLVLFLVAILFSAHGERDQPERFVTAREAHIPLVAVIVLAGLGLNRLQRFRGAVTALSFLLGLLMAGRFVSRETSAPEFQLSFELAQYLDQHVGERERVVILAKPVSGELLAGYLEKVERRGGAIARARALQMLRQLDTSPPNYQRTLVHSRLGKDQLKSLATLPLPTSQDEGRAASLAPDAAGDLANLPQWVALWSDFEPTNAIEVRVQELVANKEPCYVIERAALSVRVYKGPLKL